MLSSSFTENRMGQNAHLEGFKGGIQAEKLIHKPKVVSSILTAASFKF